MYRERGQGRFQLKERLMRAHVAHPNDAVAEEMNMADLGDVDADEEEFEVDERGQQPVQSEAHRNVKTKKKLCAQFGRKRTHNEQIIVAPCGMIIARETFYGAEGITSVVVSLLPCKGVAEL